MRVSGSSVSLPSHPATSRGGVVLLVGIPAVDRLPYHGSHAEMLHSRSLSLGWSTRMRLQLRDRAPVRILSDGIDLGQVVNPISRSRRRF